MKRHGLPDRLRLFYVFSSEAKTITYLYLNDRGTLRKHGAATNPYAIFSDLVSSGKIRKDFEANYKQWERARAQRAQAEEKKGRRGGAEARRDCPRASGRTIVQDRPYRELVRSRSAPRRVHQRRGANGEVVPAETSRAGGRRPKRNS